ncbi:unnamed protein product [Meganyctiphanes norvegica]|uniref:NACHT domain-containing protein n=1 Tax=Meganyctiphanes norvegica TaxID=48144 RepID=A0AAV2QPI1_MEGNR
MPYRKVEYKPEDYQFIRVYKCINHVGLRLILMIFEWGLRLPSDETLREHILRIKGYPNRQFKNRYDDGQRKLIDAYDVHNGEKFDVSILYKLIQDTSCDIASPQENVWYTQNDSQLEYLLYRTKCARNDISHSQISLDKAGAHEMIEVYRTLFVNLLEAAGVRYERVVTTEKSYLNNDIDEIIDYPLMENEIQHLFREQIHERSKNKMVKEGGLEMKEKYKGQSDVNPLTLIDGTNFRLPVRKIFQKLDIRDCGRHAKNMLIDSNDVLRLNDSCETVKDLHEAVDLVILEGPTGSGKTTITKLLLAEWSTNSQSLIKGLFDYDLLIYTECRNPNTESLDKLLQCLMPSTCNNLEEDPTKTLSSCTVLLIIDSLDEINDHSERLVKELLELLKRKNVTGICTMRPTKAQDVFALVPPELNRVHLKSTGIPDDQRGHFVEMYHEELRKQGKSDQSTQELIQHLSNLASRLQEHLRYPINLVHLVYLWAIAPQKVKFVTTATELYSSIHEVVQIKLSDRLINNPSTKNLPNDERKKYTMKFLEGLYIEAMLNLSHQHFCILPKNSEVELKKLCKELGLPQCEMLSAFLVTKNLWTGLTCETEYRISHTDMQEYLAACCIFKAVKDQNYQNIIKARICPGSQSETLFNTINRKLRKNPNPVSDILNIFFPKKDIPLKDYQNVLKHLSGLFVLDTRSMSKCEAKDLIKLFKKSGMHHPEDWLDIYAETKKDMYMLKYLRDECGGMLSGDIIVKDSRLAAYAILLKPGSSQSGHGDVTDSPSAVTAKSLIINLKNPSSELPDLQLLMRHAKNLTCSVEVHLYYSWRKPQPGVIDSILDETHISTIRRVEPGTRKIGGIPTSCIATPLSVSQSSVFHSHSIMPVLCPMSLPLLGHSLNYLVCGGPTTDTQNLLVSLSNIINIAFYSELKTEYNTLPINIVNLKIENDEYHTSQYFPSGSVTQMNSKSLFPIMVENIKSW